jgi:ABC-type transport system substrate-binding protein
MHEDILRQAPHLDLAAAARAPASSLTRTDPGSSEGAALAPAASPSLLDGVTTEPVRDPVILAEGPGSRGGSEGQRPPPHLLRRGWVRAVLAAVLVALTVGALTAFPHGRGAPAHAAIRPGVNLLDAKTGKVVAGFPSIPAGEIWYADGVFWVLTLVEGRSISFVGIDARTRKVVDDFATGLDNVGDFAVEGHDLWVSDFTSPTLLRLDIPSGRLLDRISLADHSSDTTGSVQVVVGAGSIWVARPDAREIVRVDASTDRIQERYTDVPPGCCLAFGDGKLWFDREGGITWLDARTGEFGPLIQATGANLALGGGFAWTANMETGTASKLSPQGRVVATYPTGEGADKVSYDDGTVWVANTDAGTITAIDTVTGALRSYRMGHVVGPVASGDGVVAVAVLNQQSYDKVLAGLQGNVARILLPAYFTTKQEPAVTDVTANPLMAQIEEATCAKLLNYPDAPTPDGWRLQPEIAASMPAVSNGGRTYTFTVRSGYRFSPPSNQPVTAEVVRYSIERALSPGLGSGAPGPGVIGDIAGEQAFRAGTAGHISGLRAVGDQLVVTLTRPSRDFLERLALPYFCPVPTGTPIVKSGVQDVAPSSAGPYYMALPRETGEIMILKRNPNYTGPRPHFFDAFAIREGIDPELAVARVEQGTWDGVIEVNQYASDNPVVDEPAFAPGGALDRRWGDAGTGPSGDGPVYQATDLPSVDYLAFNAGRPLFAERRVRLAVASALDRSALATTRSEAPSDQLLPPAMQPLQSHVHSATAGSDLRRAKALLRDRQSVAVMAVLADCDLCLRVAEAVKAQLQPIGITVRIKEMNDVSSPALARAPVDIVERVTGLPYPDGASFIAKMLGGDVPSGWLPERVGSKVMRVAALGRRRSNAAARLADELALDDVPVAVFAHGSIGELFSARMGCVEPQTFGTGVDLAALCLADRP